MSSAADADDRCRALTREGERCSRSAGEDGFCAQHDGSGPTIDDRIESDGGEQTQSEDGEQTQSEGDESGGDQSAEAEDGHDGEGQSDEGGEGQPDQATDEGSEDRAADESGDGERSKTAASDIMSIREAVEAVGQDLIGHRIDGIIQVMRNGDGDGWRATVEVVERSSVPDTQDILGKYEIELDDDENVLGYRRIDRYRRADTDRDEHLG